MEDFVFKDLLGWSRDSPVINRKRLQSGWSEVQFSAEQEIFSTPQRPDWLRAPSSILSNEFGGLFPQK
jgi:hypothetical protein